MRALLALLLVTTAAQAQPVDTQPAPATEHQRASRAQQLGLGAVGLSGGLAASAVTVAALRSDWDSSLGVQLVILAYPAGATLAIRAIGPLVGTDPQWVTTAQDVLIGAAAGVVVGGVVGTVAAGAGYLIQVAATGNGDYVFIGPAVGALVGLVVGGGVLLRLTARRVQVAPAALAAPTGERGAGLSLRLAL